MHVSIQGENEQGRVDRADVREFAKTLAGIVGEGNVLLDEGSLWRSTPRFS